MAKEINYEAFQANLKMIDKKGELLYEQARAAGALSPEAEKFAALISDEAFLEKFIGADSAEEACALFTENGIEASVEGVNAFGKYMTDTCKALIENGGELSEEELESIAGGGVFEDLGNILATGTPAQAVCLVPGLTGGAVLGAVGGFKVGGLIGSFICPGFGTAVGGIAGTIIGGIGGAVGGAVGSWKVGKVIPKIGKWIKSWF